MAHVVTVAATYEQFVAPHAAGQVDAGYEVHLIGNIGGSSELNPDVYAYVATHHVRTLTREFAPIRDAQAVWHIACLLRRLRIDMVEAHTPKGALLGLLAATIARVPNRIWIAHGRATPRNRFEGVVLGFLERGVGRLASSVVAVSPSLKRELRGAGVPAITLASGTYSGVDTERFSSRPEDRVAVRRALGWTDDEVVIGYIGRWATEKGVLELMAAFDRLRSRNPEARMLVIGAVDDALGRADPKAAAAWATLERMPEATTTGWVSDPERWLAATDILVNPSKREGMGMGVLEAGAMGVPAVALRVTGSVDAVHHERTGLLVDSGEDVVVGLCEAVERLTADPELRTALGRAARRRVLSRFRQPDVVTAYALHRESIRRLRRR